MVVKNERIRPLDRRAQFFRFSWLIEVLYIMLRSSSSSNKHFLLFNIRIGLVARICRSQSSNDAQFRQGRGSIPRFGISSFAFAI